MPIWACCWIRTWRSCVPIISVITRRWWWITLCTHFQREIPSIGIQTKWGATWLFQFCRFSGLAFSVTPIRTNRVGTTIPTIEPLASTCLILAIRLDTTSFSHSTLGFRCPHTFRSQLSTSTLIIRSCPTTVNRYAFSFTTITRNDPATNTSCHPRSTSTLSGEWCTRFL